MSASGADLFLGLDVGTQGTKALVVDLAAAAATADATGGVVGRASASYGVIEGLPRGAAEQHPSTWVEAVAKVAAQLARDVDLSRVRGVGVSGQQHGFVALDAELDVIRPAKLWCDTSTSGQAVELSEAFGHPVPTGFTASKILWLRQCEPESWRRLRHVLLPHDYINFRLTGELSMEPGDASGTGLFDVPRRQFSAMHAQKIAPDLLAMLPSLRRPGELAGRVHAAGARWLGVPEGTPVSTGGGDNMMSAIGSGAVRPGVVVLSLGTSGTVFTHTDRPPAEDGLIAAFCGSAGGWLPLLCVMNLTGVTEEVCRGSGLGHSELTDLARQVAPGCDGLLWLPFLQGERVPDLPEATGTLLGMRTGSLLPGVLYRAAIEGTSLNLEWGLKRLARMGVDIEELRLVGGAAHNDLWQQILADVCGVTVRRLEETESAALGAALQAAWAVRRGDEPDLSIDTVIEPFVRLADTVVSPSAAAAGRYEACRDRYAAALAGHYGVR
jgi:xylulokinase